MTVPGDSEGLLNIYKLSSRGPDLAEGSPGICRTLNALSWLFHHDLILREISWHHTLALLFVDKPTQLGVLLSAMPRGVPHSLAGRTRCFLAMVLTSRCDTSLWVPHCARFFAGVRYPNCSVHFTFGFFCITSGKEVVRQNVNQWQSRKHTLLKTAKARVPSDSVLSLGWKRVPHPQRGDTTQNQHR